MPNDLSEVSKVREYILPYCIGKGLDIGCGAEKITPDAIGLDYKRQYGINFFPQTVADVLGPWEETLMAVIEKEGKMDYVLSSHLLEDSLDIEPSLRIWTDALRVGGYLILVLPIEEIFKKHCRETGEVYNLAHRQNWSGVAEFIARLPIWFMEKMELVEWKDKVGIYSFFVIAKKMQDNS